MLLLGPGIAPRESPFRSTTIYTSNYPLKVVTFAVLRKLLWICLLSRSFVWRPSWASSCGAIGSNSAKGSVQLYSFCPTTSFCHAMYVAFVGDMKMAALIDCHWRAFAAFGRVSRNVLYDNLKTVVIERDVCGEGQHGCHAGTFISSSTAVYG